MISAAFLAQLRYVISFKRGLLILSFSLVFKSLTFHNFLSLESRVTKNINFFMERSYLGCPEPLAIF